MELTYSEVGATFDGAFPNGYRHVRGRARLGRGERVYAGAVHALGSFDMQRRAGLRVRASVGMAAEGVEVAFGFGAGPLRLWAPVRVVWLVNEPLRYGYGYGTLPGHPETGEEGFLVSLAPDETVWFEVRAFSRPDRWFVRAAGPLGALVQDRANDKYRSAIHRLANARTAA
ncbi:DUF1990 family protein [Rugosimonospora acidiphila]|uniref:DUF1990 family protein n=1 Tax=Rugosimonospora acidiphila TaxID=556531 RepID=UPI0031EC54A6